MTDAYIFPIGFIGFFVLFLFMPIRILWVIFKLIKPGEEAITNKGSYTKSNIFLTLPVYGIIECIFFLLNADSGSVSGLMLPMLSFLPFMFYLFFEWHRREAHKLIEDTESSKTFQWSSR